MRTRYQQSGMGMWGFMMVIVIAVFFVYLFFKLLPPYMEFFKVRTAVDNVAQQPTAAAMSRQDIMSALDRRFSIEDINRVDLKKSLKIEKASSGRTQIRITYEVQVPLFYNISALLNFDHAAESSAARAE